MRCGRCGNENPGTNRFCGMCGATLLSASTSQDSPRAESQPSTTQTSTSQSAATAAPAPARTATPVLKEAPVISGPSFLGLDKAAPSTSARGSNLGRNSHGERSSGSLDYLLEDDEPKGSAAKIILFLIALALALGFGYLRWRHEGLSQLMAGLKKPPAISQVDDSPQAAPNSAPTGSAPNSPAPSSSDSSSASNPNQLATGAASQPATPASDSSSPDATTGKAPATASDAGSAGAVANTLPANQPEAAKEGSATPSTSDSPAPESKEKSPEAAPDNPPPKPRVRPKPAAAKPLDPVTEAERYIYGRGTRQDCDRGVKMLRPAAEQSNPRAMISLGALYATGVCAPKDFPTAYRWFALALRKQPDNQPLQENLQRIWNQMTQPERQLAIKMSQ